MENKKEAGNISMKDLCFIQDKTQENITRFIYDIKDDDGNNVLSILYTQIDGLTWNLDADIKQTLYSNAHKFNFNFHLPKEKTPLVYVCAFGLKLFQLNLKDDIQARQMLDFEIGDKLANL